jgi:hypothetical protein
MLAIERESLMKSLIKIVLLSVLVSAVYGCASSGEKFETRLRPPDIFNPYYLAYTKLPGQKVCVVAVDPDGKWAFGYEGARETIEAAAEHATADCDQQRDKFNIHAKAKLFAVNDEIVYYKRD